MAVDPILTATTAYGMQQWRAARKHRSQHMSSVLAWVHGAISAQTLMRNEWLSQTV
jgi:hypothetical protein